MPWVKGQSGNPGGRSKAYDQLARLARSKTQDGAELIDFALRILKGEEQEAVFADRVDAMKWLADRGWGKAKEHVVIEDESALPAPPLPVESLEAGLGPEGTIQ